MRTFIATAKALSDENRLRALMALTDQELCLCQITELLALAPSTVSKHMSILRQAHLVEGRKSGRWTYYRLAETADRPLVAQALAWVRQSLAAAERITRDARHLEKILKVPTGERCGSKTSRQAA